MGTIAIVGMGPLLGLGWQKIWTGRFQGRDDLAQSGGAQQIRSAVETSRDRGGGFAADVSDPAQIERAFEAIRGRFGDIDILEFSPTNWNKGDYQPAPLQQSGDS